MAQISAYLPPKGLPLVAADGKTMDPRWYEFFRLFTGNLDVNTVDTGIVYKGPVILDTIDDPLTDNKVLLSGAGPGSMPDWGQVDLANSTTVTGVGTVPNGCTGLSSATAYAVLCGGTTGTGAFQSIASVGSSGQVLTSNGAAALPTFQANPANAWVPLSSATASGSATVDFTGLSSSYVAYAVVITDLVPATDATALYMRVGTGAGPTYQSGATDYGHIREGGTITTTGTSFSAFGVGDGNDAQIVLVGAAAGNNTGEHISGKVYIYRPSQTSVYHSITAELSLLDSGANTDVSTNAGMYRSTTAVTAIRFLMSSGNIASGEFRLYGLSNA